MMKFFVIGLMIVFFIYLLYLYKDYRTWIKYTAKNDFKAVAIKTVKIRYEVLVHMFRVNPKRLKYNENPYKHSFIIEYNANQETQKIYSHTKNKYIRTESEDLWTFDKTFYIIVPFRDYYKLRHNMKNWFKHMKKTKKREETLSNMEDVLTSIQADIDKLKKQSNEDINKGIKMMKEAIDNG